jgi:hypothetical protein
MMLLLLLLLVSSGPTTTTIALTGLRFVLLQRKHNFYSRQDTSYG